MTTKSGDFSEASGNESITSNDSFLVNDDYESKNDKEGQKEPDDNENSSNDIIEIKAIEGLDIGNMQTRQVISSNRRNTSTNATNTTTNNNPNNTNNANNSGPKEIERILAKPNKNKKLKNMPGRKDPFVRDSIFLYKPCVPLPDLTRYLNSIIEIRISIEYLNKHNQALIKRQIWGNDSYTSNSDAVCILQHSGLINIHNLPMKNYAGISLFCQVGRARKSYTSNLKNGIKSKKTIGYIGYSLKPQNIEWLTSLGDREDLVEFAAKMCNVLPSKRVKLEPINVKKYNKIPETTIIFNMCNEPAIKYSLMSIADKSIEGKVLTSAILKTKALYLETNDAKYELSRQDNSGDNEIFMEYDTYKFAKLINPSQIDNEFLEKNPIPLQDQYVETIFKDLDWSDIKWGTDRIVIKNKEFKTIHNYKLHHYNRKDEGQKDTVLID